MSMTSVLPNSLHTVMAWAVLVCLVLQGCGGGEEPQVAAPAAAVPTKAATPAKAAAPAAAAKPAPKRNDEQKGNGAERLATQALDLAIDTTGVDPDNIFVSGGHPNFDAVAPEDVNQEELYLTVPQPGMNSSSFQAMVPAFQNSAPNQTPRNNVIRAPGSDQELTGTLPEDFESIPEHGISINGLPNRIRCTIDQREMVLIPSGIFTMGAVGQDVANAPETQMYLGDFYIDLYEVNLGNYLLYREMQINEKRRAPSKPMNQAGVDPRTPVIGITWADARNYARATGCELPTEAEWEKAARGDRGWKHPWGNGRAVWRNNRASGEIDFGGTHRNDLSPYGVFDMAGNVAEWCDDWYADDSYQQAVSLRGSVPQNWKGPKKSSGDDLRVVRGSSPEWIIWHRDSLKQSSAAAHIGFRTVLRIE